MIKAAGKTIRAIFTVIGVLMVVIGIWAEYSYTQVSGNAVKGFAALSKTANKGIPSVSSDVIGSEFDSRIVHLQGPVEVAPVTDSLTGFTVKAGALRRTVEMYQWVERLKSRSVTGGHPGYRYEKIWSHRHIDSESFDRGPLFGESAEHINPPSIPYENAEFAASAIRIGAWQLNERYALVVARDWQPVPEDVLVAGIISADWQTYEGYVYPRIQDSGAGEVRMTYEYLPVVDGSYSVLGIARRGVLDDDISKAFLGPVFMEPGNVDAASMVSIAEARWFGGGRSNTGIAWIFIGFMLSLRALARRFDGLKKFTEVPFKRRLPMTAGAAAMLTTLIVLLV